MRFLSRRATGVAVAGRNAGTAHAAATARAKGLRAQEALRRAAGIEALEDRQLFAAELVLTKTGVPTPTVIPGQDITYTIGIRNVGTDFASNVVITDTYSTATTPGQATVAPGFFSVIQLGGPTFNITQNPGAGTITFQIGQLNSSIPATFQVVLRVNANAPENTVVTNNATVTRTEGPGDTDNPSDNTATVTTLVQRQADVQVTKELLPVANAPAAVDDGSVVAGLDATYLLTVNNNGVNDAQNVLVTDITPGQTTFVSFIQTGATPTTTFTLNTTDPAPLTPAPAVGQGGTLQARIASLPSGASATFLLTVHVASNALDADQIFNTITASSTSYDPNLTNNTFTVVSEVQIMTDIQVISSPDKTIKTIEGTFFPYTFTIYNKGPSDAQGVGFSWTTPNTPPVATPGDLRPEDRLVYDRYGTYGTSFIRVTGPAFNVTVPPRPPNLPRGTYTGSLTTLPAGVGSTYQFFVGTPQQQDFVQNSSGRTSSPDVDPTNNAYTDRFHVYDAPLIVQTVPNIQGNATQPLDLQVMSYTDTNMWPGNNATLAYTSPYGRFDEGYDFLGTVNWGDGNASAAVISTDGFGTYRVTAQHTYAAPGAYPVRVLVTGDGESIALGESTALIGAAPRGAAQVGGLKFLENATETKKVGAFSGGNAPAGTTFTAQITWGDGTAATAGTLSLIGTNTYDITGTHKYVNNGTYTGSIRVTGSDGVVSTTPMVVVVDDRPVDAVPINIGAQQNLALTNVAVATFTDPGGLLTASAYQAQIDWGDGTGLTNGAISYNSTTQTYTVRGTHTYGSTGNFTMTVTIAHGTAPNTVVNPVATVSVGPPTPAPSVQPVNFTAPVGVAFTGTVATFTDPSGTDVPANYGASIDWGDGTGSSAGTIVAGTGGTFSVTGTHTYAAVGTYNVSVVVTHLGSPGGVATPIATVINPAPSVVATPVNVSASLNTALTNVPVATFTDPNGAGPIGTYGATIDWGDGTAPTTGTITRNGTTNTFTVAGGHTYTAVGTYNMVVTIKRTGSLDVTVNPVATVGTLSTIDTVTGATLSGTEGGTLTNVVVGTFTASNANALATSFLASINWGDGTAATTGTITKNTTTGVFTVRGTHQYKDDGRYNITVTVTPAGSTGRTIPSVATIADAALAGIKVTFSTTRNTQLTNRLIGYVTDANAFDTNAGEKTVSILWGDGTAASTGTVSYNATTKRFEIRGSHKYTKASPAGGFVTAITVKDGTSQVRINSVVTVS